MSAQTGAWLIAQTLTDNTSGFSSRKSNSSQSHLYIYLFKVWLWKADLNICYNFVKSRKILASGRKSPDRVCVISTGRLQLL